MSITLPVDLNEKTTKAIALAGPNAELVGFEAVEIQRFVMANSRPLAIQGASGALQDFDSENNKHPGKIFAGGARGLFIVSKASLDSEIRRLESDFPCFPHISTLV